MATTPIPQNNSTDPQVPGNYPGTVQNPTQVPAPVNPASDPEVPPLPNDVDPNFIPNPAPVDNTINPEVPQPEENFPRKKKFDAEPVSPAANPEVPQPTVEQNLFVDAPATVSPAANPQIPPPQDFGQDARISDFPPAQDFGVDPQVPAAQDFGSDPRIIVPDAQDFGVDPQVPLAQDFGSDPRIIVPDAQDFGVDPQVPLAQDFGSDPRIIVPDAQDFGVDPQVPATPIVQNYFTDATPVAPANTGFDDFYGDQTYTVNYTGTADAVPAGDTGFDDFYGEQTYTANFTGTADARPVFPAANPQVPNIFSSIGALLSSLFGIRPTPVSPVANPQVAQAFPVPAPTVFTPTPIPPAANPQVTQPPIVQNFFTDRTPTTVVPATNPQVPLAQDFGSEPPIGLPPPQDFGSDPQIGLPPAQDFGSEPRIVVPDAQDYGSDPQIGLPPAQDFGFEPPTIIPPAQDYGSDPQIGLPPAQDFGGRKKADPDIVDSPSEPAVQAQAETRIDGPVNQALLQQSNPAAATDYRSYVVDTQNKIVEQQTRELEATQGYPASENQIAVINGEAFGTATIAANIRFKNQVESADAAQSVPANTPPPTIAPADVNVPALPNDVDPNFISNPGPVDNTIDPDVPSSANARVENVNQSEFAQKDPTVAQQYKDFKNETAAQLTTQRIAEREAVEGGPISVSEQVQIAARAEIDATADANFRYQDQIEAAGAGTVVPADTPPPTTSAEVVANDPQVVVPPTKIVAVSTETLLQNDPTTAQEYTAFKNETAQELTTQRIAEREAVEGGEISVSEQVQIAARAEVDATADANFRYQDQIQAAGAATVVPADTPPPTVIPPAQDFGTDPQVPLAQDFGQEPPIVVPLAQDFGVDPQVPPAQDFGQDPPIVVPDAQDFGTDPQIGLPPAQDFGSEPPLRAPAPPSPSPYEIFLAQEAAATDAAQAEATARFNAQFDVVTEDPQVPLAQDFGSEPPIEVPAAQDFGVDPQAQDFGTDADFNIGEFQSEPVDIPTIDTGYDDFYGNQEDVGEFQAEPELVIDAQDYGVDDADPLGDFIGDLQSEPSDGDGESAGFGNFFGDVAAGTSSFFNSFAGAVSGAVDPQANSAQQFALDSISGLVKSAIKTPNQLAAERQAAAKAQAKAQAEVNAQRKQANEGDWRVRLRLAGGADYLYKAKGANGKSAAGILQPLAVTDGVIFPYTPQITTQYQAKYNPYELTHSNYKGYFYQGSSVNEINITAQFTAQDTSEANYLLAVIHFFRSVTKMFYGQDDASKRGAPPPLVFLQGLGEYQFNLHPCVVSSFNYVLPAEVDYIRANSVNFDGTNLLQRRDRQNLPIDYVNSVSSRLSNAGLTKGGLNTPPAPPTLGTNSPTYVPTKMEIQLVLLPMQTRSQVSQQFSLKQFANGDLIRGGFW